MKNLLVVFGTRPETIKVAPVILAAKKDSRFNTLICSTGQHREMILPLFEFFGFKPDFDLDLMRPGQTLTDISVGVMQGLAEIFAKNKIDAVLVHGDTATCFVASLAAFYNKIPVMHLEAGLRSGDIYSPFPEEFNRKATALITHTHFSPTPQARLNLLHEHYEDKDIFVTGNTGIDALFTILEKFKVDPTISANLEQRFNFLDKKKKLILVTVHRRESFGVPMEEVMQGLIELASEPDVEILIPLHMNPQVRASAERVFKDKAKWIDKNETPKPGDSKIWLCEPVDYVPFVYLMNRCHFIITDSGGVQEEAPSLGKPVLVAREKTERQEALDAGTSKLIPLKKEPFVELAVQVLRDSNLYTQMAQAKNPFGDGQASLKILDIIAQRI